jgi:hypothetical protein
VLEWRYRDELSWRLAVIGLRERAAGGDPVRSALHHAVFRRRYGMPFGSVVKARPAGTGRGCRAVVAARLIDAGSEWRVMRALQIANFTTTLLLDDDEMIRAVLHAVPGIDADAIVVRLDDPEVNAAYEQDKADARSARGTAAEGQGKTSSSDGPVRYTAPSLVLECGDRQLVAGGWQPVEAYDVLIANLEPTIERTPPPDTVEPLLAYFSDGLVTAEVAALLARGPDYVIDLEATEQALLQLAGDGQAVRTPLGQDALWRQATTVERGRAETAVTTVA